MLDTKGPEIRTGLLKGGQKVQLKKDQELRIFCDRNIDGDDTQISCSYRDLPLSVKPGNSILIADGSLVVQVKEVFADHILVVCKNDYNLGEKKNVNLPGCKVNLPTLTEKDIDDI